MITIVAIVFVGILQWSINKRLTDLQDYVAIAVVPGEHGKIKLLNTGKLNIYMYKIELVPGYVEDYTKKPRLLSAGSGESAWYWLNPPSNINKDQELTLKIYVKDELNRKWVSEHGGICDGDVTIEEENKKVSFKILRIWSYGTRRFAWKL